MNLVLLLNSLYLAFDKVLEKYDVYKIEVSLVCNINSIKPLSKFYQMYMLFWQIMFMVDKH